MSPLLHRNYRKAAALLAAGLLEPAEQAKFEKHFAGCLRCRKELGELRTVCKNLSKCAETTGKSPEIPPGFHPRLAERFAVPVGPGKWLAAAAIPAACAILVLLFGAVWSSKPAMKAELAATPGPKLQFRADMPGTSLGRVLAMLPDEEAEALLARRAANILPPANNFLPNLDPLN